MREKIYRPVTEAFRCKITNEHFSVGDMYSSEDPERIAFLEENGYVGPEVAPVQDSISNIPDLEGFQKLSAGEQKLLLAHFMIDGDDGNEEKRSALYAGFLQSKLATGE